MARVAGNAFVDAELSGLEETMKVLKQLPEKMRGTIIRKGMKSGAKPMYQDALSRAPVDSGFLREHMRIETRTNRIKGTITVRINTSAGEYLGDDFYAAFIEYGFWKVPIQIVGGRIYSMPRGTEPRVWQDPKPFMRPAFDAKKDDAIIITAREIKRLTEKEVEKLARLNSAVAGVVAT